VLGLASIMWRTIDTEQRQRQAWAKGSLRTVGARLQIVSETLCEWAGGHAVLDVATGTGNTAIAVARRCCDVTAIDHTPSLLEFGCTRVAAQGVPVAFREGDCEKHDRYGYRRISPAFAAGGWPVGKRHT
jgi:2-polyprenyl-3-methyl-5-hydroxy-6-metoxy-1,4-benzoquinol methylase